MMFKGGSSFASGGSAAGGGSTGFMKKPASTGLARAGQMSGRTMPTTGRR
jgi:hypothetical protein